MGTEKSAFVAHFHANAVILGATKSDYEDFTGAPTATARARVQAVSGLAAEWRPFLTFGHSSHWLFIVNGDAATHYVAFTSLRLDVRVHKTFGLGAEFGGLPCGEGLSRFRRREPGQSGRRLYANWIAF